MQAYGVALVLLLAAVVFPDWLGRLAGLAFALANGGLAWVLFRAVGRYRQAWLDMTLKLAIKKNELPRSLALSHITCVVLSRPGFCLRGWWMLTESAMRQHRLTRVWPHFIDTLLLGSALTMAWMSGQYPFVQGWLTAKLFGLLAYIVLGAMALRRGGRGNPHPRLHPGAARLCLHRRRCPDAQSAESLPGGVVLSYIRPAWDTACCG